jgi:hypothetical protein
MRPGEGTRPLARIGFRIIAIELGDALAAEARHHLAEFVEVLVLAQVGTPPGSDPHEPPPAADDYYYYEHWFTSGLEAIVLGFQHQLTSQ